MSRVDYLRPKVLLLTGSLAFLVLLTGCKTIPGMSPSSKLLVRVDVTPQANNNNPVALDMVLVKDKKLLKELMKLSAKDWFKNRNQYRLDYPKETGLNAGSWEWVPGQVVKIDPIPIKFKPAGGLIYANYFTDGAHRAAFDPSKPIVIKLGAEDIAVTVEK